MSTIGWTRPLARSRSFSSGTRLRARRQRPEFLKTPSSRHPFFHPFSRDEPCRLVPSSDVYGVVVGKCQSLGGPSQFCKTSIPGSNPGGISRVSLRGHCGFHLSFHFGARHEPQHARCGSLLLGQTDDRVVFHHRVGDVSCDRLQHLATNEIALNWNSTLSWVSSWLADLGNGGSCDGDHGDD